MPGLKAIMPSAGAVCYLVNLAVAVSLVCGVGRLAARTCRRGSAPLRHGILLGTLVLILLSPAAVWLAGQHGWALGGGDVAAHAHEGPAVTRPLAKGCSPEGAARTTIRRPAER